MYELQPILWLQDKWSTKALELLSCNELPFGSCNDSKQYFCETSNIFQILWQLSHKKLEAAFQKKATTHTQVMQIPVYKILFPLCIWQKFNILIVLVSS